MEFLSEIFSVELTIFNEIGSLVKWEQELTREEKSDAFLHDRRRNAQGQIIST
jgi:hypothetical protein